MASRSDIFVNGGIYHIFNKTIDRRKIFNDHELIQMFLNLCTYYRSLKSDISYSKYKRLPEFEKSIKLAELLYEKYFKIEILCYCTMPNHFHLLIKQKKELGVIRFISDILNSLTRYYNIVHDRKGPIFLPQFKSRKIVSREQLIHVSRYIHLNPYSSGIVQIVGEIESYTGSSLKEYLLNSASSICNTGIILKEFDDRPKKYMSFILNNAENQRTLEHIKHRDK